MNGPYQAARSQAFRAAGWQLKGSTATTLFVLPAFGAVLLAGLLALHRPLFSLLVQEDSVIEWSTAAALAITAALSGVVALQLRHRELRTQASAYALGALLFVLAVGEEISWGQRLFGFQGPDAVRNANLQAELTVHNLSAVHTLYLIGQLAVGLYGSLGPWLMYRHRSAAIRLNTRLFVPPLFLSSGFLLHALYRIGREGPLPAINFGEWFEFCVAAGIAVFVALNARWLGSEAARVTIEDARSACAGRRSAPAPQPVRDARERPPARQV
ncbi:MAG: hypothetical protein WKF65_06475 [Gaiellaceae bacterium]